MSSAQENVDPVSRRSRLDAETRRELVAYLRARCPIRQVAAVLGISRNTVRRYRDLLYRHGLN